MYIYIYPTSLHCSSYDVINMLAILSHGKSFEKPIWQRWDLNLHHRFQSTALLSTRPSDPLKKGSIKSRD